MASASNMHAEIIPPPGNRLSRWGSASRWLAFFVLLATAAGGYWGWNHFWETRYRSRCQSAKTSEDWRTEREVAKAWANWNPLSAQAWLHAAEAAQELEDPEDVAFCLGNVPSSDPTSVLAYVEKANLEWTVLNRPLDAIVTSRKVLDCDPKIAEIHSHLISFYAMTLQRSEMIRAIRNAMTSRSEPPESYTYLMLADVLSFSNGGEINSRWLTSSPNEVRFKLGMAVSTAANIFQNADASKSPNAVELEKEAKQQLQWFLDSAPHDPVILTYMMNRAYEEGDAAKVGELLRKVDDTATNDHMVWFYRGWYHIEMKEFAQAEDALQEAIRLHPISSLARHEYARLLRLKQRPASEVSEQQELAAIGKRIRGELVMLTSARDVSIPMLMKIALYAARCGDDMIANRLFDRLGPPPSQLFNTVEPDHSQSSNSPPEK